MTDAVLLPLSELVERSGMHRNTIYRWLRRKGIKTVCKGVLLGEVATKWPELYETLQRAAERDRRRAGCPTCGPGASCRCLTCGAIHA